MLASHPWKWEEEDLKQINSILIACTEKYLQLLGKNKVKGTKFIQQNYLEQKDQEIDLERKVHPVDKIAKLNHGRFS